MLSNWTIKNFKSIKDKTTLELAPLTIFAGANSSGKSSVIQSILMVAQTIQNSVPSKSVILNGHIIKLGSFNDILSNSSSEESISIGFTIKPVEGKRDIRTFRSYRLSGEQDIKEIVCNFSFSAKSDLKEKEISQLQPRLEDVRVKTVHLDARQTDEKTLTETEILIKRSSRSVNEKIATYKLDASKITRGGLISLEYEVLEPKKANQMGAMLFRRPLEGDFVGASLQHFLPSNLTLLYDRIEEEKKSVLEALIEPRHLNDYLIEQNFNKHGKQIIDFILELFDEVINETLDEKIDRRYSETFIRAVNKLKEEFNAANFKKCYQIPIYTRLITQKIEEKKETLKRLIKLGTEHEFVLDTQSYYSFDNVEFIESFFRKNVEYLGPLRDEPKPVYPLLGSADPKDIGFKGENTAAVLDIHKSLDIEYIKPENFLSKQIQQKITQATLLEAVLDWLSYMGIAEAVRTADQGKLGHDMKITVQGSNEMHDLTHVGVGVSQVLPILVQSLLAEKDSTLIFEQPELHLNPRVQTRLGDFFASMVFLKKQCIVETHSEYLINRLRYLVAISDEDELSSQINIYFVEKEKNKSIYNKVKINQFGIINDWPKGFFDENEKNAAAILKAAMNKKNKTHSQDKDG